MFNPDAPTATVKAALADISSRQADYDLYRRYYRGQARLRFASEKYKNAFAYLFQAFSLNLCRGVVNAPADRLEVEGFSAGKGDTSIAAAAWEIWQANRMDIRAGQIHKRALRDGDAYLIVWPNSAGDPILYPNSSDLVSVSYDPERPGVTSQAVKVYLQKDAAGQSYLRATVYTPDAIYKYISTGVVRNAGANNAAGRLEPYRDDADDGGQWPLPNAWGIVPVFHFANDACDEPGESELSDIVPLQDALNKCVYDMMVAMEFAAYQQRYAVGLEVEVDPTTGKALAPFDPGVDRIWAVANENVKFGEFSSADLSQFLDVKKEFKADIAQVSGTPMHYLSLISDPPSGEALKTLESRFVKKVRDRQSLFGAQWEDAVSLALRMAGKGEGVKLSAQWKDAETKSEQAEWDLLTVKSALGVDKETIFKEGGYGEADAKRMAETAPTPSVTPAGAVPAPGGQVTPAHVKTLVGAMWRGRANGGQ